MNQRLRRVSISNLPAIAGLTCMVLAACTVAEAPGDPVTVHRGRLKFSDMQALFNTIEELNALPEDQPPSAHLEERFAGFQSLGDTERDLPAMTPAMRSVLNPDGLYQVANRIFLILGDAEYIIPESEEDVVRALVGGAPDTSYVASDRIQVNRLSPKATAGMSNVLNAKYQREFSAAGHVYKFVHEAYVDQYATYLMACFRSKFEYRDGSTWRHAGEIINKEIASGTVYYWIEPNMAPPVATPHTSTESSNEIVSCQQVVAPFGTCLSGAQLTAEFKASGKEPHTIGQSYNVSAAWPSEFTSLRTCNK